MSSPASAPPARQSEGATSPGAGQRQVWGAEPPGAGTAPELRPSRAAPRWTAGGPAGGCGRSAAPRPRRLQARSGRDTAPRDGPALTPGQIPGGPPGGRPRSARGQGGYELDGGTRAHGPRRPPRGSAPRGRGARAACTLPRSRPRPDRGLLAPRRRRVSSPAPRGPRVPGLGLPTRPWRTLRRRRRLQCSRGRSGHCAGRAASGGAGRLGGKEGRRARLRGRRRRSRPRPGGRESSGRVRGPECEGAPGVGRGGAENVCAGTENSGSPGVSGAPSAPVAVLSALAGVAGPPPPLV